MAFVSVMNKYTLCFLGSLCIVLNCLSMIVNFLSVKIVDLQKRWKPCIQYKTWWGSVILLEILKLRSVVLVICLKKWLYITGPQHGCNCIVSRIWTWNQFNIYLWHQFLPVRRKGISTVTKTEMNMLLEYITFNKKCNVFRLKCLKKSAN